MARTRSRQNPPGGKRKVFAGRYAYVKPLGRGAGGAVYLAEDLRADDRQVALKVLSAEACATVQGKMLRREFEILSKLDHPNLVRVYDYGSLPDGGVFLAEEYIDGFSLQDARALLEPEALIDTTLQLLQGLSYLHGMGMIHRDIKPANVMLLWLDDARAHPMVKLVDFGLSSADPKRDTLRGGTRSYMAPEIIRGEKGEFRSDLYSLGVTLYYAMCGVLPFGPRTKDDPPPTEEDFRPPEPHRLNPDVPLSLSRFTMVLLRQVPDIEFMDAGEALQALAGDTDSLEWVATGQLANNLDIAAPPVLRGYFERGILVRQDAQRDVLVDQLLDERPTGRLFLVRGGRGVGKTRVMNEVACSMKLSRRVVVSTTCHPDMTRWELALEVLRQLVELAESRNLRVSERFLPNIHMLSRLSPWVGEIRGADQRSHNFAWIREALQDLVVMIHPDKVVIFIEDVHLADEDSLAFLQQWYDERPAPHRPDIVASMCPGEETDGFTVLNAVDVLEIEGLRAEDVAYFFKKRLGVIDLPDEWIHQVALASRGNPAYVEEMSRHLIDAGVLGRRSSIRWYVNVKELLQFSLPRGIRESLRRRLLALGTLGRETLELMALLGKPVEWAMLRKLLVAGGENAEDAERTIELLQWRHFVDLDLDQSGRHLRLIEPDLTEVVLGRINPEWRRSLHRRIGERLRKRFLSGRASALETATHLADGGRDEEASVFFEAAADRAVEESEFRLAATAFERAMELGRPGPATALLRIKLAETALKNHETARALEYLDAAWSSAERTALDWLMYRVCVGGIEMHLTLGRPNEAREWLDRLRDLLPVMARQAEVLAFEARFLAMRGNIDAAKKKLHGSMQQCQHFGNRDGLVLALGLLARLEVWSGRYDHATSYFEDAVEIGKSSHSWSATGSAMTGLAAMQRSAGEFADAMATLNEAFEIVSEHGSVDLWSEVLIEMAETHLAMGELDAAFRRASEAKELAAGLEHVLWSSRAELLLGEVDLRRQDDVEEALERMKRALTGISESPYSFPFGPAALERYGRALLRAGRQADAEQALEQARKLSREFGIDAPTAIA